MADLTRALLRDGTAGGSISTSTFAARGSGSSVGQKKRLTDIGPAQGSEVVWDGTYWRLTAPTDIIMDTTLSTTGTTGTSEQFLKAATLPQGCLRLGRTFAFRHLSVKSGIVDAVSNTRLRLGTAGTAADTAIVNTTGFSAASRSYPTSTLLFAPSATQIRILGSQNAVTDWSGTGSSASYPNNFTVPDIDANALILSVSLQMAGSTDTPNVAHLIVTLFP